MLDAVALTWSYISSRAVRVEECVWTADTTPPDATAITAKRDSTGTWPNPSHTAEPAKVRRYISFTGRLSLSSMRDFYFYSFISNPQWVKIVFKCIIKVLVRCLPHLQQLLYHFCTPSCIKQGYKNNVSKQIFPFPPLFNWKSRVSNHLRLLK